MGMTIAEKIFARKGGRDVVAPGDIVTVEVDTTNGARVQRIAHLQRGRLQLPRARGRRSGRFLLVNFAFPAMECPGIEALFEEAAIAPRTL